jgi:hypothetical protein
MAQMRTYIAGLSFRPGARERLAAMMRLEEVRLVREPHNKHDKNAVAVYDGAFHLGYVPAVDAPAVGRALMEGRRVRAYLEDGSMVSAMIVEWDSN